LFSETDSEEEMHLSTNMVTPSTSSYSSSCSSISDTSDSSNSSDDAIQIITTNESPSYSPILEPSPKRAKIVFCNGYKPVFENNIFLNFPLQLLAADYNRQWRAHFEKGTFYSLRCFNTAY